MAMLGIIGPAALSAFVGKAVINSRTFDGHRQRSDNINRQRMRRLDDNASAHRSLSREAITVIMPERVLSKSNTPLILAPSIIAPAQRRFKMPTALKCYSQPLLSRQNALSHFAKRPLRHALFVALQ